jgi:hypothetical protein
MSLTVRLSAVVGAAPLGLNLVETGPDAQRPASQ